MRLRANAAIAAAAVAESQLTGARARRNKLDWEELKQWPYSWNRHPADNRAARPSIAYNTDNSGNVVIVYVVMAIWPSR